MDATILTIDNFYDNPDEIRKYALSLEFYRKGNYPGYRSQNYLNAESKEKIQKILFPIAGNIKNWISDSTDSFTGSFQICTYSDRTWIHTDTYNNWAGVLYLTPDAPLSSGTAFYQHKKTGAYKIQNEDVDTNLNNRDECFDYTKWEKTDVISNRYNRLLLFRADMYHASLDYFGYLNTNCRLTQVFFIETEYPKLKRKKEEIRYIKGFKRF